jgi:hypothetical protein
MSRSWTIREYVRLFRDYPPNQPNAPAGRELEDLAVDLGRSTGAVLAQWNDGRSAVLNQRAAASSQLIGYLRRERWRE